MFCVQTKEVMRFNVVWLSTFCKRSSFVFCRRQKVIHAWDDTRVNKQQNHFICTFKNTVCISILLGLKTTTRFNIEKAVAALFNYLTWYHNSQINFKNNKRRLPSIFRPSLFLSSTWTETQNKLKSNATAEIISVGSEVHLALSAPVS